MKKSKIKLKSTINKKERGSWLGVNPVTKVIPNKKHYNRKNDKKRVGEYFD